MRESFLEVKIVMLFVMLFSGSRLAIAQDKSKKQDEWEATAIARMPEDVRQKYERLKKPFFAQLELLPRLLELSEGAEELSKPYKVGDKIFFRLLITNTSSEKVSFSVADPFYYNRPQLLRDGELVPYRDGLVELLKSKEKTPGNESVRGSTLLPHHTETVIIEMKQWYEPLQPGRYLLTVKRRFIWGGEWIESPPLTFEVVSK
ncbi:MAG: hypothetical protein QOJ02_172 [Acidobacteriota bacterium]|jgi:hypothetical protein|nr:hypothetical protein [Acidobacteriota bacterium]